MEDGIFTVAGSTANHVDAHMYVHTYQIYIQVMSVECVSVNQQVVLLDLLRACLETLLLTLKRGGDKCMYLSCLYFYDSFKRQYLV